MAHTAVPWFLRYGLRVCLLSQGCLAWYANAPPTSPPAVAMRFFLTTSVLAIALISISSADDRRKLFEETIRPTLVRKCYSCHSQKAGKKEGGLLLDSRSAIRKGGEQGPAVVPGKPEQSLLLVAIGYQNEDLQMPPDRALPEHTVRAFRDWVAAGAWDPRETPAPASEIVNPSDPVAGKSHWAFQPLQQQQLPVVRDAGWPWMPIDHYVLHRLEQRELHPVSDASRLTLLKRLCLQITGLPPTAEQLKAFPGDIADDATERLVDELLATPQFGERWGRHWLDLARYADSNGLDENFLFREAWRYRNWVIDAVNRDLPYPEFLEHQIAGDLLPFDSIEQRDQQRIAAGFMVIGPKVLLGNSPDERIMDVADEQLDTIGRAVLGQTPGCARCHDHKFDPIPTADYYAMAGIMTSTSVMQQRYMLGSQRNMERLVGLGENGDAANGEYEAYWREKGQRESRLADGRRALELLKQEKQAELEKLASEKSKAVAERALDLALAREDRIAAQQTRVKTLEAAAKPPSIPPRAMIPGETESPRNEPIRMAGRFDQHGEVVPRGVLQVLSDQPLQIPGNSSGRLQFAHWLTDASQPSGRLAARVLANRIWHHLMGRGIVVTVDNFGRTGRPPTHPELLDYLASRVLAHNWSLKSVIREIALSRTFQLSSEHNEEAQAVDPENTLLWRAHRLRKSPEALRDTVLHASGRLDLTPVGSSVAYLGDQATAVGANKNRRRTDYACRTVYLPVIRNDLPEVLDVFDFADPHVATGGRPETLVPAQQLYLLNSEFMMAESIRTAERIMNDQLDPEGRVRRMYGLILNRPPDSAELADMTEWIRQTAEQIKEPSEAAGAKGDDTVDRVTQAWALACQALFASSEFQIAD